MDLVEVYAVFLVVCERRLSLVEDGCESHVYQLKVDFAFQARH